MKTLTKTIIPRIKEHVVNFFTLKKYFVKYTQWHEGNRGINPDWYGNLIIKAKNIEDALDMARDKINTSAYSGVVDIIKKI